MDTQKIGLSSVPHEGKDRLEYITDVEEAIFKIPLISLDSRVMLGCTCRKYGNPEDGLYASLLFHMLDKGIIFTGKDNNPPKHWGNSYDMILDEETLGFLERYNLTIEGFQKACEDISQYLDGFKLKVSDIGYAWMFAYSPVVVE